VAVLSINKQEQAMVTIPKELVDALQWKSGDRLIISKAPNQSYLTIENMRNGGIKSKEKVEK